MDFLTSGTGLIWGSAKGPKEEAGQVVIADLRSWKGSCASPIHRVQINFLVCWLSSVGPCFAWEEGEGKFMQALLAEGEAVILPRLLVHASPHNESSSHGKMRGWAVLPYWLVWQ